MQYFEVLKFVRCKGKPNSYKVNNILMERLCEKMLPAQRINLFPAERTRKNWNPEEDATNYLLQISNQQSYFPDDPTAINNEDFTGTSRQGLSKSGSALAEKGGRRLLKQSKGDPARPHRKWRKSSVNYLSGEQVCVMRKEKVVHLSNFLVFQQQEQAPRYPKQEPTSPLRGKLMSGLVRKRNSIFSAEKEERLGSPQSKSAISPTQRMNQSCELWKDQTGQIEVPFRSTSPNFRNKKVINYFKYRLAKQAA